MVEKWEKWEIFTVLEGKILFWKKRMLGKNIIIWRNKHSCSHIFRGIYISLYGFLVGWGEKYDDLLSEKANIMGKGVEKREKGDIFTVLGGKKYDLGK